MQFETLLLEQKEPGIHLLTINRPQALNALSPQVIAELTGALAALRADPGVRVLLVTGAGEKSFVAGADIAAMSAMSPLEARAFALAALGLLRGFEAAPFPVIALVNGYALGGGCELAMACDWIVAAESAQFGQPEVNLGICPGFGGTQRLPRLVGRAMAMEMCVTGRAVKAPEALRIGLVNHVVPAAGLLDKGLELGRAIAAKGPVAVGIVKHLIQHGQDLDLENALRLEADNFAVLCATADKREGMAAFLEKRKPAFIGC
ncbi:MAG: enoyl-CoA hydratase/isomerase family protein [Betaproteobacteria bacterium]|nr:enoyl-CoA hydratase/isomerase family protein [Betaproteobacteria bacterium]